MKSLQSPCALALVISLSGCAAQPSQSEGSDDQDSTEEVATAEQPLLGSAHASAFGTAHGTPGFSDYDRFGSAVAAGDLNGDGATDLVVGVQNADYGSVPEAGAVAILWGQKTQVGTFGGLSKNGMTMLYQPGAGNPEMGDQFGTAIAIGDFNCDGHPDLAVGAFYDAPANDPSMYGAGNVSILYGPGFTGGQLFWQGSYSPGVPEMADYFGMALASGNFNGDAFGGRACDDLAISAPGEDVGSVGDAGAVTILYGRSTGLNTPGAPAAQMFHQDTGSIIGVAESGDSFGSALAAGDFNDDGIDDLAIGAVGEDHENPYKPNGGVVHVIKGSPSGLTDAGNALLLLSDFPAIGLQAGAYMGSALASGDFDGDGRDDLAVGVPGLTVGGSANAGGVLIYRQMSGVLSPKLEYDQDHPNMPGLAEHGDHCGNALAAGDFNGDGQDDLASGCPNEDVTASDHDEGALNVAYFGLVSGNLTVVSGQLWDQNSTYIPDACGYGDAFGDVLAAGDFNGDGYADLAAGTPNDDYSSVTDVGSVNVFYGAL